MKRFLSVVLAIIMIATVLSACGGSSGDGSESQANKESESNKIVVGVSFHSLMNDVFTMTQTMLKTWAENPENAGDPLMDLTITVADGDINKQISDVKDLISKNPDVILIDPADSTAIEPAIKACRDAGIPVVTYNRPLSEKVVTRPDAECLVDAYTQGYDAAKACFKKMNDAGIKEITVVMVNGETRDDNSIQRAEGVKKAASEFNAKIAAELPCNWDPNVAAELLPSALTGNPETNCVYVATDGMLPGVQTALEGLGRWAPNGDPKHMWIASCDVFENGYNLIGEGYVDTDTLFDVRGFVRKAVENAFALSKGESVEAITRLQCPLYTKENYEDPELVNALWWKFGK
jgi:ribose transport system substrate-binding protein